MTEQHTSDGRETAGPSAPAVENLPRSSSPGAWPVIAAAFAMALALLATAIAGLLWWQYRQFYVALHGTDTEIEASLERVRATQRAFSDRLDDLAESTVASGARVDAAVERIADFPAQLADVERRVEEWPARLAAIESRLDAIQGGSIDARNAWLRAEAEYYLTVANTELALGGRWDNAVAALELADDRLRALADPALAEVRRRVADELVALRTVDPPDVERIVFRLASLAARVDELPLRAAGRAGADATEVSPEEAEPGLDRLLAGVKRALSSLVTIERREEAAARTLSAERRTLARRELAIELQLAQIAALRGEPDAYAGSLDAAAALLERDFDAADAAVKAAAALVDELAGVVIDAPRPDIGGSLALLRELSAGAE
ncbi:MAG TPA: uroporphyrinogen-III C-methyltransferase [Gammaproteobacteria bacterium]